MTIDADAVAPCEGAARHRVDRRYRFGVASERVGDSSKTLARDKQHPRPPGLSFPRAFA